jgi:hypothetical protein
MHKKVRIVWRMEKQENGFDYDDREEWRITKNSRNSTNSVN